MAKGKSGKGVLYRIAGPVVVAKQLHARMYDLVRVGEMGLIGEVIQISQDKVTIQVYEDTSGLKPGEKVVNTNEPLCVKLGPGLITSIYDGIQRPLPIIMQKTGNFIQRGVEASPLDEKKKWEFTPSVKKGDAVTAGQIIGSVQESAVVTHHVMVPPDTQGKIKDIKKGKFTINDTIAVLDNGVKIRMVQEWPVRVPRPVSRKLQPTIPLITGQRIFDSLFPIAKGGVAAIPGPFGAGKTVSQHQLAKWADADIIVYVGCGERGNEMTEVLTEFPKLIDPRSNKPLMNRTVLIANTSNMPVAAREASIYTGVTIAEYYRDMGYSVALMADSTSRWAEALREISSRLEEMPGEEGYPAYLASRLADFYERAGRVVTIGNKDASLSIIGAVSPPGGDFSEPVTQNTLRVTKAFWALDARLAQRRHFPAINWLTSYSLYKEILSKWFRDNVGDEWPDTINWVMNVLQEEEKLLEIVQLVGSDALPEKQQMVLEVARMIRENFLQQNAYHEVDTYCSPDKTYHLMKIIQFYSEKANIALDMGVALPTIVSMKSKEKLANLKFEKDYQAFLANIRKEMENEFEAV